MLDEQPIAITLSKRDAAKALSISERTLFDLTAPRGPIPAIRLAGRILYRVEALREWAKKSETMSPTSPMNERTAIGITR